MQCANCGVKKFLFLDAEEMIPAREVYFCRSCYQKVLPFLEERNDYPTHAKHLEAKKVELQNAGMTESGMSVLSAYCAYLDRLAPKSEAVEVEAPLPTVDVTALESLVKEQGEEIKNLSCYLDETRNKLRVAIWIAAVSGGTSILSLLACLMMWIGG